MKRRTFLATVGTAAMTMPAYSYRRIAGANDRVGMALVGSGRRGRLVMGKMVETGQAEVRMLCDVWDEQADRARQHLNNTKLPGTRFLEEVLDNNEVDAVLIATPDHLHVGYAENVLDAKKHLYLEKPATLHFDEGKRLQAAVDRNGMICQTGMQQRSGSHYREVKEKYFNGGASPLGDVVFVRTYWSNFGWQRRQIEPRPKPADFNWERFLGPAPKINYNWAHYDAWRNYKTYGAGILSDLLTHWADVAQWMLDQPAPLSAVTTGGIYFMKDDRTNPDTVNAILQYPGWNLTFECSIMPVKNDRDAVLFHGTGGKLEIDRGGYVFTPHDGEPTVVKNNKDLDLQHAKDFLDAVIHGKANSAPVEIGLQAVNPSHLAVAAYWSGQRMRYSQDRSRIIQG